MPYTSPTLVCTNRATTASYNAPVDAIDTCYVLLCSCSDVLEMLGVVIVFSFFFAFLFFIFFLFLFFVHKYSFSLRWYRFYCLYIKLMVWTGGYIQETFFVDVENYYRL
jgi:hypothetical protein